MSGRCQKPSPLLTEDRLEEEEIRGTWHCIAHINVEHDTSYHVLGGKFSACNKAHFEFALEDVQFQVEVVF